MTYRLIFDIDAQKDWNKLNNAVKTAFKKILERRLNNPVVPKDRIRNCGDEKLYKIKLKSQGFRLVYKIEDELIILLIVAVGKRENDEVYINLAEKLAHNKIND
jgi:mRNA interferase RelE/StbE